MAPRTTITALSRRPADPAFCFMVKFYEPKHSVRIMWTDSREYAEGFASTHHCYARTSVVQERTEWALGRRIGLTESGQVTTKLSC